MKRVVVDASVIVKWLLPDREAEANTEEALEILQLIKASRLNVRQPPHWLAEAAAVITRLSSDTAMEDIEDLYEMGFEILDTREVYLKACELSSRLNHHLFDTLYHAVALNLPEAILITADELYYRKAEPVGQIMLLKNLNRTVSSQYKS
jgi:predicted nucleic acid-binding protein